MTGRKVRVPSPAFAGRGEMPVWDFRVLPVMPRVFVISTVLAVVAPIPTVFAIPSFTALVLAFVS